MSYQGWKNHETWNVALWIGNDEILYRAAKGSRSYRDFVIAMNSFYRTFHHVIGLTTPDGVSWNDANLDVEALDRMLGEL